MNNGCVQEEPFCPLGQAYNRRAPTKQNLMCNERSAMETILNHEDFEVEEVLVESNVTTTAKPKIVQYDEPKIQFLLPRSTRYTLVLERTAAMDLNNRWTNVKRALYRFIQYVPVGTEISIITFGKDASLNLPPTIVTDANREGLHGRIPRKVLSEDLACVFCAVNMSFNTLTDKLSGDIGGNVILVTGSPRRPQLLERLVETADQVALKVFPIVYPGTAYPEIIKLARHGKHYAIPESDSNLSPLNYLSEVLLDILHKSEGLEIQKVHETKHLSYEFAGTFTLEESMLHKMAVTLNIDDEDKVEFFEITNPSGKKHLFSKFEDGMVVFNHPGQAQPGIWTYHAKLYHQPGGLGSERVSVDVVSQSNDAEASPFLLEVFTNVDQREVDAYNQVIVIYAKLTQGGSLPVLGARVIAKIFRPGGASDTVELTLRDNGAGDPDITGDDGIYSVYFSDIATVPGFYSIQVTADHNAGQARTMKTLDYNTNKDSSEGKNQFINLFETLLLIYLFFIFYSRELLWLKGQAQVYHPYQSLSPPDCWNWVLCQAGSLQED